MMKTAIALCLATCATAKLSQTQESQLERLKAGDVSKKEIELVLAHFNENQSWSDPYAAIRTTYCKGDPVPGCVPLENVGREGHTYLHHIITHYDNLAEWTVFSQAGAPSVGYNGHRLGGGHMQPGVEFNDYLLRDGDSDSFFVFTGAMHLPTLFHAIRSSYRLKPTAAELEETRAQCPKTQSTSDGWERLDLPEWFQRMMASRCGFQEGGLQQKLQQYWQDRVKTKMPEDGMVFFSQGARFAVSRDRIHQRPREEYMDLLAEVSGARDPCVNYMNEWLWYYIMGRPQAAPCETPDIKMEAPASMASRFLSGTATGTTGGSTGSTGGSGSSSSSEVVKGTAKLTVPNPDAFVADAEAKNGVKKGLATLFGIAEASVEVELSVVSARRLATLLDSDLGARGWSLFLNVARSLTSSQVVQVDYTITPPAGTTAADLVSTISAKTSAEFTTGIQDGVTSVASTSYTITVTETGTPAVSTGGSTGTTGGTGSTGNTSSSSGNASGNMSLADLLNMLNLTNSTNSTNSTNDTNATTTTAAPPASAASSIVLLPALVTGGLAILSF